MIKSLLCKFALLFCLSFIMTFTESYAQQTVFTETFSTAQSSIYTTNGAIGTTNWTVARSGQDFGARISGGILTLTNDATSAGNPTGWISATTNVSNFDNAYNPILSKMRELFRGLLICVK